MGVARRRAVLVMADAQRIRPMNEQLTALDVDVIFTARDGVQALALLPLSLTDLLIADLVLPILDGPELVRRVRELSLHTMPAVILMAAAPMPGVEAQALIEGACAVLRKPVDQQALSALLSGLSVRDRVQRASASEQHILQALQRLGLSVKLRGTHYLVEAISLASRDVRLLEDLTATLYPMVAEKFKVEQAKVEHAMRRAVESAWSGGYLEAQNRAFGNTIDARRGKPTSGEMIARVAELLRVKEI